MRCERFEAAVSVRTVVAAVAAGAVILAHLGLFVLPQNAIDVRNGGYWAPSSCRTTAWETSSRSSGTVCGASSPGPSPAPPADPPGRAPQRRGGRGRSLSPWRCCSAWASSTSLDRHGVGRSSSPSSAPWSLTLVASYLRYWPFGFVRTNFYLIPLLILIAGIGAVRSGTWALARPAPGPPRAGPCCPPLVAGVAVFALIAVGVGLAATDEVAAYRQLRTSTTAPAYGDRIGDAVATVRA